jgi:predicted 2-oxoglutarate/Fe(II)-dependent dioxygenase YbiX
MRHIEDILFTNEECKSILSLTKDWKDSHTSIPNYNLYSSKKDNVRKSLECKPNRNEVSDIVLDKLSKYDIISIPDNPKILKYEKGCFFVRHRDRGGDWRSVRKKTLIIQLSEESYYEGGELVINDVKCSKSIGNTIIMDSGDIHEVKEITEGTRYALIMWLENKHLKQNSKLI